MCSELLYDSPKVFKQCIFYSSVEGTNVVQNCLNFRLLVIKCLKFSVYTNFTGAVSEKVGVDLLYRPDTGDGTASPFLNAFCAQECARCSIFISKFLVWMPWTLRKVALSANVDSCVSLQNSPMKQMITFRTKTKVVVLTVKCCFIRRKSDLLACLVACEVTLSWYTLDFAFQTHLAEICVQIVTLSIKIDNDQLSGHVTVTLEHLILRVKR